MLFYNISNVLRVAGFHSDLTYGNRYTLDDVKESLKRTGVGLKGTNSK